MECATFSNQAELLSSGADPGAIDLNERSDTIHVEDHVAFFVHGKRGRKAGVPYDLAVVIRKTLVDGLAEGFIPGLHHDDYLRLQLMQISLCLAAQWTVVFDGVHYSPR